ncbi:hypothetical protein J0X19_18815 [Hymenobacter sp. BT186]|uniref:Uncharacterized protein n=1 Tax=Hymenobacter telluris TaxID=2816474 RepID=A0A939F0R3_9BACT|nr:hypothetical protein [Hymenobacter telluris]MBO0360020.1 hypothetical protein [Hymenobacter telluris]MBW3376047.1 hypothetical protein [Hymenobacter norwichensis]
MAYSFTISSNVLPNGRTAYLGTRLNSPEARFTIGYRTRYQDNFGLYNTDVKAGLVYQPAAYRARYGFWADFIYPTAYVESKGSFFCLNTYDRARFTFGFMQYAAHVPNGDFVRYVRALLQLPLAAEYFPRLTLKQGRIQYQSNDETLTPLESDTSTKGLMEYLNPTLLDIETQETICAARMVHWAQHDALNQQTQVELAIAHFQANLLRYHRRLGLDQAPARVCIAVCDILHQGRATFDRIAAALNTGGNWDRAYANLLTIGAANYAERIKSLKQKIAEGVGAGVLQKTYHAATNTFV